MCCLVDLMRCELVCTSDGGRYGCSASSSRSQASSASSSSSAKQFPRMVPGRRTVHGGVIQDRRVAAGTTAATNGPSTMADAQAGGRTLFDKLTSKFSAKR